MLELPLCEGDEDSLALNNAGNKALKGECTPGDNRFLFSKNGDPGGTKDSCR